MTLCATVRSVREDSLVVFDCATAQEIVVHTSRARCFFAGERVVIRFNGVMTASIPPQITATCISRACC